MYIGNTSHDLWKLLNDRKQKGSDFFFNVLCVPRSNIHTYFHENWKLASFSCVVVVAWLELLCALWSLIWRRTRSKFPNDFQIFATVRIIWLTVSSKTSTQRSDNLTPSAAIIPRLRSSTSYGDQMYGANTFEWVSEIAAHVMRYYYNRNYDNGLDSIAKLLWNGSDDEYNERMLKSGRYRCTLVSSVCCSNLGKTKTHYLHLSTRQRNSQTIASAVDVFGLIQSNLVGALPTSVYEFVKTRAWTDSRHVFACTRNARTMLAERWAR